MRHKKDKIEQFLACFRGWCEHFRAPPVELYDEPGAQPCREDRCLVRATPEWLEWLERNSQGASCCLQPWGHGIERHDPLNKGVTTAEDGWRGLRAFAAIQIIHHVLPNWPETKMPPFLEIDFDLANPAGGLLPLIEHGIEWTWYRLPWLLGRPQRRTNPYLIARMLRRRGIAVERI